MKQNLFHEHCISIHDVTNNNKKIGIGFIVEEKDGNHRIITCKHVVEGKEDKLDFEKIVCCETKDIALIETSICSNKEPAKIQKGFVGNLVVATYDKATNGTSLVFKNIAVEVSEKTTISEGSEDYSAYRLEVTDENDKIEAGHSGSPVFDVTTRCVVGFISLKGESEAYAIAIENIIGLTGDELIEEIDISYLEKIESYLKSKIDSETLKSTAKTYLEPLYQRELASKTMRRDIIDYLDNHDKNPLYCVVKELFENDDEFIEEWLEKNAHTECKKVVIDEEDSEKFEDRIVVDFESVAGKSNRYDVFIRYFVNSAFQGNDEKVFEEISINEVFKQDLVSYLSSDIKNIENLDIFLPKELLLLDIKQWNSDKRNRLTKKYKVNIHIRERADLIEKYKKSFIEKWNLKINEFQGETLSIALKEMKSDEDEATKDTKEIGLWYLYTPIDTAYFYEDNMFSFISIRGDNLDKVQSLWGITKDTMELQNLKEYIDHDDRKDITLIWDDPNIPLKPKEGVTQ